MGGGATASPDPVLIAGAGPVGVTTALLLARFGVPSVVLEAEAGPDQVGSKAICMQRDVLDVLDRVGVAEAMVAEGTTWTVGRTYYRDRELFTTSFPDPGGVGPPPWINISQCSTEALLLARAAASPLVALRWSHRVVGLSERPGGVEVRVAGPRGEETLWGSHLVGADGAHSSVRALAGVGFPGRSFADRFLIVDVRADLPFPNERRFYFDPPWNPGRQVLIHECPGKVWRIDWQVPEDYDLDAEAASGALDARIRTIVGDQAYEVVWRSVYRFSERVAQTFRVGRVALVGDAAHLYAPFGARGLNSGVQDADNLAWKVALVHRGWVGPEAAEILGRSYAVEREEAAAENLAVTTATMDFLVPQTEAQWAWRRRILDQALADPAARAQVDSGKLAEPHVYAASPLTTPAPAGARLVPGALCPDGPCPPAAGEGRLGGRLRRRLGAGLVVLAGAQEGADLARAGVARAGLRVPVAVEDLAALAPGAGLGDRLGLGPAGVAVVRPDGHLSAVAPDLSTAPPEALAEALWRTCGEEAGPRPGRGPGATVTGDERGGGDAVLPTRR